MKTIIVIALSALISGCVTSQLMKTTDADYTSAIAISQTIDPPDPMLTGCLQRLQKVNKSIPTTGGGIATVIAEKWAWDSAMGSVECVVVKAKIQAFFAKFGAVIPINP